MYAALMRARHGWRHEFIVTSFAVKQTQTVRLDLNNETASRSRSHSE